MKQKIKFKQTEIGLIPESWEVKRIIQLTDNDSEIVAGPFGSNLKVEDYREDGEVPIIRLQNIERYKFINENLKYTTKEKYDELHYHSFKAGDVVLAKLGVPIGKTCAVPSDLPAGIIVADVVRFRISESRINKVFLLYVLNSNSVRNQLSAGQLGTTRPRVNLSDVRKLLIPLPPLPEQRAIAKVLSDLDDKIELNNQMNKTLEAIGQAIFKRWFVDFEFPNEQGKPYKSSGGKMVDSELGMIPEGWRVGTLSENFKIAMGQSPPGSSYNEQGEGISFFQGRTDFGFRFPSTRLFCSEPSRFAEEGDTLVSVRAPVGDINMAKERICIGRGLASLRHKSRSKSFTYYFLRNIQPKLQMFESEGTVFGSVSKEGLEKITAVFPSEEQIRSFEKTVGALDIMIENNESAIQSLTQLRDSLLPRLMSGKLRVRLEV